VSPRRTPRRVCFIKAVMVMACRFKEKNTMSQLITRNEVEDLCEQELQSKFYGLMQDLIRSQNMLNERAMALAALETVEAC
jgi:hypothetical protein